MGCNGWKSLEMDDKKFENGWKWLKMAGNG